MQHATVVGGGPVGAVMSMLLARRGVEVEVFEARPDPRLVAPSDGRSINLTLAERGWHAFRAAGVEEQIRELTIPLRGRLIHHDDGSAVLQPYTNRGDAIFSASRAGLSRLLLNAAESTPGVRIHFGRRCLDIDLDRHTVLLASPTPGGPPVEVACEVVIGADGAYSSVRQSLMKNADFELDIKFSPVMYRELRVHARDGRSWPFEPEALHLWPRGESMIVGFPNLDRSLTVSTFMPATGPVSFSSLSTRRAAEEYFATSCPELVHASPSFVSDFFRRPPALLASARCEPWVHEGWLTLIGDAAHTIVPFLGQGLNAGLEDCTILADVIAAEGGDWSRALPRFYEIRRADADAVVTLAQDHFEELASAARDPAFVRRKALEQRLHEVAPTRFVPVYDMVSFRRVSYADVADRKSRQDRLLDRLMSTLSRDEPLESATTSALILRELDVAGFEAAPVASPATTGHGQRRKPKVASIEVVDVTITEHDDRARVAASVISPSWQQPREVWFELPRAYAALETMSSADPWVASLLLPAMRQREDLSVDAPVSAELLQRVGQVQGIYTSWMPSSQPVAVHTTGHRRVHGRADAVGLFFSCGVDSWYSLLKSEDRRMVGRSPEVTHLITVHGVDIDVGDWKADVAGAVLANTQRVANEFGLSSVAISTNIRQLYTSAGLSWHWGQAGALAAIALLLQDSFKRILVAAGPTNANVTVHSEMEAGGCHPLLLPLYSTSLFEFVVDGGEVSRLQKVERLARSGIALETLRICWANHQPEYNCGRCAKCVRTSLELALFGALDRCLTLPHRLDPHAIASTTVLFPHEVHVLRERYERLLEVGASHEVLDALQTAIHRAESDGTQREHALETIRSRIGRDEPFVLLDEDEIRYELGRTHARAWPFTCRDGLFNGLPANDEDALRELDAVMAAGASKFVIWKNNFWALDYYPALRSHLESICPPVTATPEVLIYELIGSQ